MSKSVAFAAMAAAAALTCNVATAEPLFAFLTPPAPAQVTPQVQQPAPADESDDAQPDPRLQRQVVGYSGREAPGTIIIDTPNTYLYLVLGSGRAMRYGIGIGREGFTWSGVQQITKKAEWPDWTPPPEMIERQPYLPRFMAGGPGNPLGARAMYLGSTLYESTALTSRIRSVQGHRRAAFG